MLRKKIIHARRRLGERLRPGVEVFQPQLAEQIGLQIRASWNQFVC